MTIMNHLMSIALIAKECELFNNNFFSDYENRYDKRLIFVKLIYLFQSLTNISLGYNFFWNRDGPYSKTVNGIGYIFQTEWREYSNEISSKNIKFVEPSSNEKLNIFSEKIRPFLNISDFMEVAATLEFLREDNSTDESLIRELIQKKPKFENSTPLIKEALIQLNLIRQSLNN